jgi:hypothetical protein
VQETLANSTTYVSPSVVVDDTEVVLSENDLSFVAALGWVLLIFGSAWAYCKAVCGWNGVKQCSTSWLKVNAVCK